MDARKPTILALRAEGKTYDEIAHRFGISRQRVHQIAHGTKRAPNNKAVKRIPFVGLRNWMLENDVSVAELSRRCGVTRMNISNGSNPNAKTQEKILKVTGLSRAECFRREDA